MVDPELYTEKSVPRERRIGMYRWNPEARLLIASCDVPEHLSGGCAEHVYNVAGIDVIELMIRGKLADFLRRRPVHEYRGAPW